MAELLPRLRAALADRYAIDRELGRGGTATVYLAQDLKHGRAVAVKVLRPELAAALGDKRPAAGLAVGTPGCMSPVQAMAEPRIAGRAVTYALGCVLYEMLAGHPPFLGTTAQEILARHTLDPVPPLRTIRPELPAELDRAVSKALAKAPADRFPSAAAFSEALTHAGAPPSFARQAARPAVFVAAGVAALVAGYVLLTRRPDSSGEPARSIAVLPFVNIGADPNDEPFSDGMSEELITALAKIAELRVTARTSAFSFKGKAVDVREIGSELNSNYVLAGSVRRAGPQLRVSAQLINATTGYHLWSDEYDRDARDVFAVQDEIARAIVAALAVKLSGTATKAVVERPTEKPEAHDLYLKGRYFFTKRDSASLRKAADYFERAIQKDSSYALAWSGLGDAYSHTGVFGYVPPRAVYAKAKAAALRALALDSAAAPAHPPLGFIALFHDWHWPT